MWKNPPSDREVEDVVQGAISELARLGLWAKGRECKWGLGDRVCLLVGCYMI